MVVDTPVSYSLLDIQYSIFDFHPSATAAKLVLDLVGWGDPCPHSFSVIRGRVIRGRICGSFTAAETAPSARYRSRAAQS